MASSGWRGAAREYMGRYVRREEGAARCRSFYWVRREGRKKGRMDIILRRERE